MMVNFIWIIASFVFSYDIVSCCSSSLGVSNLTRLVPDTSITAATNLTVPLDNFNDKPYYGRLDGDRAYCFKHQKGFYVQIDLGKKKTISAVIMSGWRLNGKYLKVQAYALSFSIDGKAWFVYNHDQRHRWYQLILSEHRSTLPLLQPVMARYVRLFPETSDYSGDTSACLQLDLLGCDEEQLPVVRLQEKVEAEIGQPAIIPCVAEGQSGMRVWWNGSAGSEAGSMQSDLIYSQVLLPLNFIPKFENVFMEYNCVVDVVGSTFSCTKSFVCNAQYKFEPFSISSATVQVHITIKLPSLPTLRVIQKSTQNVTLAWSVPKTNDIPSQFLEARLACNNTSLLDRDVYSFSPGDEYKKVVTGLDVYTPYMCQVRVVLKNRRANPKLGIRRVVSTFRTLGIAPSDVLPTIIVSTATATSVEVFCFARFTRPYHGKLSGYLLQAEHLQYGNRAPARTNMKPNSKRIRIAPGRSTTTTITGLSPWSKYKLGCVAYNEDDLESAESWTFFETPVGKPSEAPHLTLYLKSSHHIIIGIELEAKYHNGPLEKYRFVMNPGNVVVETEISQYRQEFKDLRPFTNYSFYSQAATSAGYGQPSKLLYVRTDEDSPGPPDKLSVVTLEGNLFLRWHPPVQKNGLIVNYRVELHMKNNTVKQVNVPADEKALHDMRMPSNLVDKVSVRAVTQYGYESFLPATASVQDATGADGKSAGMFNMLVIVMSIITGTLTLIIIIIIIVYLRRRRRRSFMSSAKDQVPMMMFPMHPESEYDDDVFLGGSSSSSKNRSDSVEPIQIKTHDPILKNEFAAYVNRVQEDDWTFLENEFRHELHSGKCHSWHIADKPENRPKNRYCNIAAYDHSRVILKHDCKRRFSDYINANYIQGYNPVKDVYRYIATQGPMESVVNDFWLMVWQEDVNIIIMLTNLCENQQVKCSAYWPSEGSCTYGNITVTRTSIDKTADYLIRTFTIEKTGSPVIREVRQFHFISWPDHGAPEYPTALLSLRRRVRHYMDDSKPVVVHCSAGIGRSGCYILIDTMLERIDKEGTVDIFNYTQYLRTRRINMVQSIEQYVFAHNAILEYIAFGNTEISGQIIWELDKRLQADSQEIRTEYEVLTRNTCRESNESIYKVRLKSGKSVEAYNVDGYKQRNVCVLMKSPLEQDLDDFWRMVFEKRCHTIVMLNRNTEDNKEYARYWPDLDSFTAYGDISVLLAMEVTTGNIIKRKLKVNSAKHKMEVQHFQFLDWPPEGLPEAGTSNICTLMQAVQHSQQNLGNGPILVHEGDSFGRSGAFIAIYNSIERVKVEQLIDVLQCVRSIRIAQPAAVSTLSQYRYIYETIRMYLEGFETYWNFEQPGGRIALA